MYVGRVWRVVCWCRVMWWRSSLALSLSLCSFVLLQFTFSSEGTSILSPWGLKPGCRQSESSGEGGWGVSLVSVYIFMYSVVWVCTPAVTKAGIWDSVASLVHTLVEARRPPPLPIFHTAPYPVFLLWYMCVVFLGPPGSLERPGLLCTALLLCTHFGCRFLTVLNQLHPSP